MTGFCDLITPQRTLVGARFSGRDALIDALAGLLAPGSGLDAAEAAHALRAREKLGSTAIGRGVAIPHARHVDAQRAVVALIRLAEPLDLMAPDDEPVDIAIGILTPDDGMELSSLSALVKRLRNADLVEELRTAKTAEQAVAALRHTTP